jgi:hypothetical protein
MINEKNNDGNKDGNKEKTGTGEKAGQTASAAPFRVEQRSGKPSGMYAGRRLPNAEVPGQSTPASITDGVPGGARERGEQRNLPPPRSAADAQRAFGTTENRKEKDPGKERKTMKGKWLDFTPWLKKPESSHPSSKARPTESGGSQGAARSENVAHPRPVPAADKTPNSPTRETPHSLQIDMLSPEDIYMAAGIFRPRGHGVHKVVEMLRSSHMRGLSRDVKRAAMLMGMEAAGITIEQLQQDAKGRQEALDAYEAEQKKQLEAEWTRKKGENLRIEEEMELVKERYIARISRNLASVAREKSVVAVWQTLKREEVESMLEAVELCVRPEAAPAPTAESAISVLPHETPIAGEAAAQNMAKAAAAANNGRASAGAKLSNDA